MYCAISGVVPDEPVVSKKSGHLFEKRLILKHIQTTGKCPVSGEDLTEDDLIAVQENVVVRPRTSSATSIPGLLSLFQSEWDSVVSELYQLKKQLHDTKQQLAQTLYENDAAKRVIARLLKERDEALEVAKQGTANTGTTANGALNNEEAAEQVNKVTNTEKDCSMEVEDTGVDLLPPQVLEQFDKTSQELIAYRKNRKVSPSLLSKEKLESFREEKLFKVHTGKEKEIVALAQSREDSCLLFSAGKDKTVKFFTLDTEKTLTSFSAHKAPLTDLVVHPNENILITSSMDKTAVVWHWEDGDKPKPKAFNTVNIHEGVVTQIFLHPCLSYFGTASEDCTWAFHDLETGDCLSRTTKGPTGIASIAIHPDGLILGTGFNSGELNIWDIREMKVALSLCERSSFEDTSKICSLSFSENGYHMASMNNNRIDLWDLRKPGTPVRNWNVVEGRKCCFDSSGVYLGLLCAHEMKIIETKKGVECLNIVSSRDLSSNDSLTTMLLLKDMERIILGDVKGSLHVLSNSNSSAE
ncbi:nucleotide binding / ubiquitin-protein ligase [Galdieria sulphuraria]|uniref:Pre-mRNA-processing factor 19 n=1 Tax=Galdieria sulphuraria TaxID=130081 RepID=M2Y6E8_GALSU|nr:nucleotide binding / ubiquitin-protein ligase [Galdieria sulphuraria]EME31608.1 nucleotide binding / ubiquitin-protein ligase [Galdieria sulphuraria]|eukprot:XP_005708128.1 nucleotide binding / ubiquitin-protein ligase [Galdieria sulphuraria]